MEGAAVPAGGSSLAHRCIELSGDGVQASLALEAVSVLEEVQISGQGGQQGAALLHVWQGERHAGPVQDKDCANCQCTAANCHRSLQADPET